MQKHVALQNHMPGLLHTPDPLDPSGWAQEGNGRAPESLADGGAVGGAVVRVTLPWPPSVNTIWRSVTVGGSVRVLLSKEGRQYRQRAIDASRGCPGFGLASLRVSITAYPPDRRRRDLDNVLKAALDAMTHACLWVDDSQIADLRISKACDVSTNPRLEIEVRALQAQQMEIM